MGYPNYSLTNNNANIHRVEERLNSLKATKEKGNFEQEYKTFRVVENTEGCRENMMKIEFLRPTEYDRCKFEDILSPSCLDGRIKITAREDNGNIAEHFCIEYLRNLGADV